MKWEYKTIWDTKPILPSDLNKEGEQGWELCGVLGSARNYYYYFKRLIN